MSRFLFVAQHRRAFGAEIIAELRGVIDDTGESPFWEAGGRHFFGVDFHRADLLSMKDKTFIADLLPEEPIFVPLLPEPAQRVIGQINEESIVSSRILEREGFEKTDLVDIFDAGPILRCDIDRIASVRNSSTETVKEVGQLTAAARPALISSCPPVPAAFRCGSGKIERLDVAGIGLECETASALQVRTGDAVRILLRERGPQ